MVIKKVLEKIEDDIKEVQQQGDQTIDCDKMLLYLNQLKGSAEIEIETARELARYAHERNLERYKVTAQTITTETTNMFTAILETGASAAKSIILINGGAAVALLAFLGNMWGKGIASSSISILVSALYEFGLGVFWGAMAMAFRYLSQFCFGQVFKDRIIVITDNLKNQTDNPFPASKSLNIGYFFLGLAILSGFTALVMFLIGINKSVDFFS